MDMSVSQAQADMRRGYYGGGAGILASSLAWAAAAGVAIAGSAQDAIWTLLAGGVLIHPLGVLICKLLGASGAHAKGNPLGQLAGSSTFWLIFSLPLAYAIGMQRPAWFFVAMLLVIGGRYLVFATLYGMRLYWALGLALAASGFALAALSAPAKVVATTGAALELVFAAACILGHRRQVRGGSAPGPTPLAGEA